MPSKAEKGMAFFAEMLAKQGVDINVEVMEEELESHEVKQDVKVLQAEGVLLFLETAGRAMLPKQCKECGQTFATRYKNVGYCDNLCRAKALKKYGIAWDYSKDAYASLGVERPMVVDSQTYSVLREFAERILHQDILEIQEEEDQTPQEESEPEPLPSVLPTLEENTSPALQPAPLTSPEPKEDLIFGSLGSPFQ